MQQPIRLKNYFVLLPAFLLFSCKESLRDKLINGKYWDNCTNDYSPYLLKRNREIDGCWQFNRNGTCYNYVYEPIEEKGKIHRRLARYIPDDVIVPQTWELKGDSILNIQGFDRLIVKVERDSLTLVNIKTRDTIYLLNYKVNDIINRSYK